MSRPSSPRAPSRDSKSTNSGNLGTYVSASLTLVLAFVLALLLVLGISSCTQEADPLSASRSVTKLPLPEDAISDQLMLSLRQAKNFHHIADVHLQSASVSKAIAAVQSVLAVRFPANAPEAADVKLDARARLGMLMIVQGNLDDALKVVDQGIAGATRDSFFLSNVYTVKGEIEEAMAVSLDASDRAAADQHRENAIRAREKSIAIDSALQDALLGGGQP